MIGIIAAMKVEAEGLIREMKYKRTRVISGVEFTRGKLRGKDAVVCVCGVGKVRAGVPKKATSSIEVGQTVKVVSGPFDDFDGTVAEVMPDAGKVRVMVSIFGRETPVELSFDQVARI